MAFFKKYIKYGMSDGTATEPVWTPQTRTEYARRMHVICSTLSISIARTTANTLLHGANTLLVTDWSHLLAGVTRLLYRRLGLDACLLKASLLRFLQYCLRVCTACSTLDVVLKS